MVIDKRTVISPKGDITLYRITAKSGASVEVSNLGAGLVSVIVPDANGEMADVVLGYANPADYLYDGPCAGKIPGRYANRIAKGVFALDGREYHLAVNNGPNALHGGPEGFQNRLWNHEVTGDAVKFSYKSSDGEEGYPGNMNVSVTYRWSEDQKLLIELAATSDARTVVNLTNHAYFNLAGENSGNILNHTMWLAASHFLPTDETLIPTGEIAPVSGTPMDFTFPKQIGNDIGQSFPALVYGKGYDNCWVIDDWDGTMRKVAVVSDISSGRVLEVSTTQPAVQVYTGNWLAGSPVSKSGRRYDDYDGVAIECQGMPDAPNKPGFPSQVLDAGEEYRHMIEFSFKTK